MDQRRGAAIVTDYGSGRDARRRRQADAFTDHVQRRACLEGIGGPRKAEELQRFFEISRRTGSLKPKPTTRKGSSSRSLIQESHEVQPTVVMSLCLFGASWYWQDSTRLRFEVVKDGATVANPKSPSRRVRPQHESPCR
jgi:hypothetical protein